MDYDSVHRGQRPGKGGHCPIRQPTNRHSDRHVNERQLNAENLVPKAVTKGERVETMCQVGKHFTCEENRNITEHLRVLHKPALPTDYMYIVQYMEAGRGRVRCRYG
jgi:hypothetical protein